MANTTSLAFPNMFNISQNKVSVLSDSTAVSNRTRLLMLTEPTEVYNEPDQGVGLHKDMWQYNTDNEKAIILDKTKKQLKLHEPYAIAEETSYADGLLFTGEATNSNTQKVNELEMTISVVTTFNQKASVRIGNQDVSIGYTD